MGHSALPSLSIFVPAYNEAGTIAAVTRKCLDAAKALTDDVEVIIIDDASTDGSDREADRLAQEHREVRVVHHASNRGLGASMAAGFRAARKEWVFYTDGDDQFDLGELPLLVEHAATHDLVAGYRLRRAEGGGRAVLSLCFHGLAFLLFSLQQRDIDCSFKLVRRRFLERVPLLSRGGLVDLELFYTAKTLRIPVARVGVHHYPRRSSRSKCLTPSFVASMLVDLVRLRFLYARRARPGVPAPP
ncbi:MAG: glycosyltransferase family 2 protein [Deltaproteobacteria bacterium]|nr:glycosyltransferase family 2 protein [Deltaproteobacteria bacterium]